VPRGGKGVSSPPPLHRKYSLHGSHGPRGAQVDATYGKGLREAGEVAVTLEGIRLRGADATGCITPRGRHDFAYLGTRGGPRADTGRGTLSGPTQNFGSVAVAAADGGRGVAPPEACGVPRGAARGWPVQEAPGGHGWQRQSLVSRGSEQPLGPHGTVGRSRANQHADPRALGGNDTGALPPASRASGGQQDVQVDATVVLLGIYVGGRLRLCGQLCALCAEQRR